MQLIKLVNHAIKCVTVISILMLPLTVWADMTTLADTTPMMTKDQYVFSQLTQSQFEKLTTSQQQTLATEWGLSVEEYDHYLVLMETTINGFYYGDKHLDPSWILGFNAPDELTRQKYAAIAIQNERARITKELAFQRDFQQLQNKLYPNELPIILPTTAIPTHPTVASMLQSGDSFLLFTDLKNPQTDNLLERSLHLIQTHPGTRLDVFLVGTHVTDDEIRAWAAQHHIAFNLVQNKIITLNHDNGKLAHLTQNPSSTLPQLVLHHKDVYQPVIGNFLN